MTGADPRNPFLTREYSAARLRLGDRLVETGGTNGPVAPGFERDAWMGRMLEVPSVPILEAGDPYWSGLLQLTARRGVTRLVLGSFGALGAKLPPLPDGARVWTRAEHVLELGSGDLLAGFHRTHRQRVRQAIRAECRLEWSRDPAAIDEHAWLMGESIGRRGGGSGGAAPDVTLHRALLEAGAGRLARVVRGEQPVASCLVLLSPHGGYLHSSGSSVDGKSIGAHHFMVAEIARHLQEEGRAILNLGGTRESETGLREFKTHFGGVETPAEAAVVEAGHFVARVRATAGWFIGGLARRVLG